MVHPSGPLAPLVRAAGEHWDVGIARAAAFMAALLCGAAALTLFRDRTWHRGAGIALVLAVGLLLAAPSTLLQLGLRDSTAPWFFTNDSTYQIEQSGDLVLHGKNPYGHDYRGSGLERFYTRDGTLSLRVREHEVALRHFAYFPGAPLSAAVWRLLPQPFDDYRLLVLVAVLAGLAAALAFHAPLGPRLALGAVLVCNPVAVRCAWFGQNDPVSLALLVLAFALVTRSRLRLGGGESRRRRAAKAVRARRASVPRAHDRGRGRRSRPAEAGGARVRRADPRRHAAVPDRRPGRLLRRHRRYGAGTYRIVGYGVSAILIRLGVLDDREGSYPFTLLALLTWVPLTVWLLLAQRRANELWVGAAGFAISILWLMFIGRTFNNYYLLGR